MEGILKPRADMDRFPGGSSITGQSRTAGRTVAGRFTAMPMPRKTNHFDTVWPDRDISGNSSLRGGHLNHYLRSQIETVRKRGKFPGHQTRPANPGRTARIMPCNQRTSACESRKIRIFQRVNMISKGFTINIKTCLLATEIRHPHRNFFRDSLPLLGHSLCARANLTSFLSPEGGTYVQIYGRNQTYRSRI